MRLPLFYGWVIVAVAFVTMGIGVNARTAFSLLFPPILDEFGDAGEAVDRAFHAVSVALSNLPVAKTHDKTGVTRSGGLE